MRQPSAQLRVVVEGDHALERRINETVVGGHDQAGVGTFSLGEKLREALVERQQRFERLLARATEAV